ncbi:MAG: four helix bundle protein [Desulfobacterales bacterium]
MGNRKAMTAEIMKDRTKKFAKQIILLCRKLPKNREGNLIGNQIFRSGTSVASNYRAACRGRSKAEFIAKMGIVEEEADETIFWLEVIEEVEILKNDSISSLMQECNEILSIVVSSINTARKRK